MPNKPAPKKNVISMNAEATTTDKEITELASALVSEIQALYVKAETLPMRFMSAYTQTRSNEVKLYLRVFSSTHGQARFTRALGVDALRRTGRVLVISNIEFEPPLQGRGLLKALMQEAISKIEDLDIVEFENVINDALVIDLLGHGYIHRDAEMPFGSLFKIVR